MNHKDHHGNTALHKAAELGLVLVCRFLITNGADSAIFNNMRRKPIDLATPSASKVIEEEPARGDSDVESQLLEAAKSGDLETVKVGRD